MLTLIIGLGHMVPAGMYSREDGRALVDYTLDHLFRERSERSELTRLT